MLELPKKIRRFFMLDDLFQKYLTTKNIVFFIIAILFIIFVTKIKDIAILFFASYVIACSLNPLVGKISKKINRSLSAGIVLIGTLCAIFAFFIPLFGMIGHELKSFLRHIPQYFDTVKTLAANMPFINHSRLANIDFSDILSSAADVTSKFVNQSISISINLAQAFVYLIVAIIIIYYFMADKEKIREGVLKLFPEDMKERASDIISSISAKIGGYVVAQIATMSSVGIIMTIGLMLSGIEYALLLGLVTAVLDIVPIIGPAIALVICLVTAFKSGAVAMLLVLVVFAIAQLAENNLVRPLIFGKILNLHPLIIYLFLFITAQYLGLIGVIFAPAIAATVCVLIEELYIKSIN